MTFYPYSPIFIDLTFKEYAKLFTKFFTMNDRSKLQTILEDSFLKDKQKEHLFPVLSVRTGFDLFLQAANFPKGSEIIMTGINIPDMSQVVKNHGMIAVPVDVDMDKLAPKLEDIEQRITPNTKAIILSYIFGATFFIEDIVKLAKKHNLYIVEDLAETFMGQDYNGHQDAHVSLFSFGAIKYNTALNGTENAIFDVNGLGGIAIVRNSDKLSREMRYILEKYPMQPTSAYFKKCAKLIIPALITNNHTVNTAFRKGGAMISDHYEEFAVALLRGFPVTDGEFLNKFRFQVCTPLLANLAARMIAFNQNEFKEHINKIKFGQDMLLEGGIKVPGHKADIRSFWLFPIVVSDVQKCYRRLNEVGVNAYLGATQLKIVESPPNSKFPSPEKTREFFDKILYLPIQKNVPMTELVKICKDTIRVIQEIENEQMIPASNVNPRPRL